MSRSLISATISSGSRPPKPWRRMRAEQVGVARGRPRSPRRRRGTAPSRRRPLGAVAGSTTIGPVDLADRRRGDRLRVPLDEQLARAGARARARSRRRRGRPPSAGRSPAARRSACAQRLGQAVVEVAGHLAELHQRALHVAERARRPARPCAARGSRSSSARRSADANSLRAAVAAYVPPTRAPRRARSRLRRPTRGSSRRAAARRRATAHDHGASSQASVAHRRPRARSHRVDRPEQRRHESFGVGDDGVVVAVDPERLGARDRPRTADLAAQRHDAGRAS